MPLPLLKSIHSRFSWFDSVKSSMAKVGVPVLFTSLALTGAILGIRQFGLLQGAELAAYDRFMQSQPEQGKDDRLLVVGIDEIDLQTLRKWPITDHILATAIKKLEAFQPRAIGIDVFRDIPIEPGRAELLKQLQQSDQVVIVCKVNSERDFGAAPPPGIPLDKVGTADLPIDPGGILRRTLLSLEPPANSGLILENHPCNDPKNSVLSLSFNLTLMYLQALKIEPEITKAGQIKLGSTLLHQFQTDMGGYRKADANGYQLLLHYRSQNSPATQVSLMDVLNGKVPSALVRDRIVLIGYTTPLAKDDFYTPYSSSKRDLQKMPGVFVHAQSISQLLSAVLDRQPLLWVWSLPVEVLWIFGWSLLGGILAWYLRHPFLFSAIIAIAAGAVYLISLLIFFEGGWIPVVPAIAALIGTAIGVVLLDRFNNSTYGQTVYKTVKTFLNLEVDIDEEKLEKQVAEITETDYFKDLQDTVKSLREQQKNFEPSSSPSSEIKDSTHVTEPYPTLRSEEIAKAIDFFNAKPIAYSNPKEIEEDELDFIAELNQESKRLKADLERANKDSHELDFISEVTQEAAFLKQDEKADAESEDSARSYQKFTLDDASISVAETDTELDSFDYLQQEKRRLKDD